MPHSPEKGMGIQDISPGSGKPCSRQKAWILWVSACCSAGNIRDVGILSVTRFGKIISCGSFERCGAGIDFETMHKTIPYYFSFIRGRGADSGKEDHAKPRRREGGETQKAAKGANGGSREAANKENHAMLFIAQMFCLYKWGKDILRLG
jgi:hypothetical protein